MVTLTFLLVSYLSKSGLESISAKNSHLNDLNLTIYGHPWHHLTSIEFFGDRKAKFCVNRFKRQINFIDSLFLCIDQSRNPMYL